MQQLYFEKVPKEYGHRMSMFKEFGHPRYPNYMCDILVFFVIDYGKERTDISPNASDYDPCGTEIYVSRADMDETKKSFPDADDENIKTE